MDLKRGISFFLRKQRVAKKSYTMDFKRGISFFVREMKPESGEQVLHHGFETWNFVFCQRDETREWRTGLTPWISNVEFRFLSER